jgi:hypothetical protein
VSYCSYQYPLPIHSFFLSYIFLSHLSLSLTLCLTLAHLHPLLQFILSLFSSLLLLLLLSLCLSHSLTHTHSFPVPSGAPTSLNVTHPLPTSAELSWTPLPPEQHNGIITGYTVKVVGPDSAAPRLILIPDASATSVVVSGLRPFTVYTFVVSAMTTVGTGPAANITSTTPQGGQPL